MRKAKKLLYISIAIVLMFVVVVACGKESPPIAIEGQWHLETISNTDGEILTVGRAYNQYDDFHGHKDPLVVEFEGDGDFQIRGGEKALQGRYSHNKELDTSDSWAINMDFDDGRQVIATIGVREYHSGEEVDSLLFTLDEKIYSFIKARVNEDWGGRMTP